MDIINSKFTFFIRTILHNNIHSISFFRIAAREVQHAEATFSYNSRGIHSVLLPQKMQHVHKFLHLWL